MADLHAILGTYLCGLGFAAVMGVVAAVGVAVVVRRGRE